MGHIFVSYSRHDLETVDCMVGKIESAGMKVWIDRDDIKAGNTWRVQIVQAIDSCDAFVLMLSSNSAVSDNVRKEIDLAQDSGRTVFIIRLDSVEKLPAEMRYQLVGLQYIDIQRLGMDDAVNQLIDILKEHFAPLKPDCEQPVRQAEIVIQGVDPSTFDSAKQEQLVGFISELTETPESQLQIAKLTVGSVHVFVDMPAKTAFELKTRALNRDKHFRRLGIKSLRLVGNKKYINISLGILTTTATIGALKLLWLSIPSLFPSILGITGGKVLVITSAIVVTTAMGLAASERVATLPIPIPTATQTLTPMPSPTATSIPTPISHLLVLNDTLCWGGPDPAYDVVSSVMSGTRVELLGRGNIAGWLIVLNPRYQLPCWIRISDLQIDARFDMSYLPIFTPPAMPPSENRNPAIITPTPWSFPPCVYAGTCIFPISTPVPPPN